LGVFTSSPTTFFIAVLTWCGQQKASKAFFYWCYVPFIEKECQWLYKGHKPPPYQGKLLLQGKVLLGLEFYQAYLPFLKIDMLHAIVGGFNT
jgi:hypothetical protein